MTILNFVLAEAGVYLVTDTVVSCPEDMSPAFFTTKVHPVPHWQGLICGTGVLPFIVDWYTRAVSGLLALDIRHLDEFAPAILRELWSRVPETGGIDVTSTIYHLGFDERESRFIGFAYRSTDNFASEELAYGTRIKPGVEIGEIKLFPEDFIRVAEAQKRDDEGRPPADRVGVGGHVIAYTMELVDGRVLTKITQCHEFDDFERAYYSAMMKLPENSENGSSTS